MQHQEAKHHQKDHLLGYTPKIWPTDSYNIHTQLSTVSLYPILKSATFACPGLPNSLE